MNFARRVIDLMLFRSGPQELPGDQVSLVASAAAYCILLFIQVVLIGPAAGAAVQALLATILLGLYVATLLRLRGLPHRFPQTATALFSSGAVLTVIMLVPTIKLRPYLEALSATSDPSSAHLPPMSFALIYLVIGIWGLAIYSNIYRHALNVPVALGVAATIGFEVFLLVVFSIIG